MHFLAIVRKSNPLKPLIILCFRGPNPVLRVTCSTAELRRRKRYIVYRPFAPLRQGTARVQNPCLTDPKPALLSRPLCARSCFPANDPEVFLATRDYWVIGKRLPRIDAQDTDRRLSQRRRPETLPVGCGRVRRRCSASSGR